MARSILHPFVALEGLDGSGTTTQLRLAGERLAREGVPCFITWEPTDGPVGTLIRSILRKEVPAHPCTVAMLYAADRHEHLHRPGGIVSRSAAGELVLSDRYLFSSLAYQSIECSEEQVATLNAGFPLPELVIFLDTPVAVCQARLDRRQQRELFDGAAFQGRVREGYLRAFESFRGSGMRIERLDGDRPPETIAEEVWKLLRGLPIP